MKKGYKMTPTQIQQRFRQTIANQAEKVFSQQVSLPHPTEDQVDNLADSIKQL